MIDDGDQIDTPQVLKVGFETSNGNGHNDGDLKTEMIKDLPIGKQDFFSMAKILELVQAANTDPANIK